MKRRFNQTAPVVNSNIIQPGNWSTLYNGYGSVTWDGSGVRFLPKASTSPSETHAVMILSKVAVKDFVVKIKAKTIKQLRTGSLPNAWECFWFVFNYVPSVDGYKTANYIVLKPNGIEIGTMDSSVGQKFLYTGSIPKLVIGQFNEYAIVKSGKTLSIVIDGTVVVQKTFDGLYDQAGVFGLYSEDADCLVESVI